MKIHNASFLSGRPVSRALLIVAAGMLAGCAVGPDFEKPAAPVTKDYATTPVDSKDAGAPALTAEQKLIRDLDIPARWWTLFRSKPLDDLVERAIKGNPDLLAAQASMRVAREGVYAAQAGFFPTIGASYDATRQRTPDSLSSPTSGTESTYNLHTAQLNVSYSPDIFGANRRAVESLEAQDRAQRFQFEATYLTLTSNLAVAALTEAGLRRQIDITKEVIALSEKQLESVKSQVSLGQLAQVDLRSQEAALAQLRSTLPPLEKQLAITRDEITALTGDLPTEHPDVDFDLDALKLPGELPVSLPSKLVEQRPDIRAAQELMRSASAQIGVAASNRLPNITLSASIGSTALDFNKLFKSGNNFWGIGGDISAPLFDAGALQHKQRAAEAAFDQAKAQYKSTVVLAFQNVADSLHAIKSDTDLLRTAVASEEAARKNLEAAEKQYALGDLSVFAISLARQNYLTARLATAQAELSRYSDSVALFQALGGGWWNRPKEETDALMADPA